MKSIDAKLDSVVKLLIFNVVSDPNQTKAIQCLAKAGMKYAEIGEYFGLSEDAVKKRISRFKVKIKTRKENEE
ncbi:sigma factor-like helix-turn-helix DNA-binding protein [Nitrososphaera sp.]|uniref:sigma factor-like helix-turn-helix DNA-binding protein n=1 Tax=Nitrososphaera sp. TaxID=1971748 RepID=UPI00179E7F39|nr:sigma factor-like helix-turn-helix DNA-binding protein [Nitrososphaera sp.]NWG37057.1 sigma-70 region 4 domain-containing protein [Nitrososphaera sp.]